MKKKIICLLLVLFMFITINNVYADEKEEVIDYAATVTEEMSDDEYWSDKLGDEADKILLDYDDIAIVNNNIVIGDGTGVNDITLITEKKTQAERKNQLVDSANADFNYMINSTGTGKLYADGELVDNETFILGIKNAILETGFENNDEKVQLYAVGVKRTTLRSLPTDKVFGYDSPDDTDDEASLSSLDVNEPFVIRAKCVYEGETYYWGFTNNLSGWVNGKYLAIFDSKEEWLEAWQVSLDGTDFIVVIENSISLEPTDTTEDVELKLGTVLKLVSEEDMPDFVEDRDITNNYVVYLPTRDEDGKYVREYALIPEHYDVSVGYLPLTEENILHVAFNTLGDRYGWGGMLGAMDCSAYIQSIYKAFGLTLPRNTTYQKYVPEMVVDVSKMSDEEKEEYIESIPVGSAFYMPGHAFMYIGSEDGVSYAISATGSLSDAEGAVQVRSMNSIIITPLTVRRRNGSTWLSNITHILIFDKSFIGNNEYTYDNGERNEGNISYNEDITSEMSDVNYWLGLLEDNKELTERENDESLLVITQDRIILEPSLRQLELSKKEFLLGTTFDLVPLEETPKNVYERGPWNNYVVDISGEYALISEHYNVSVGYLPVTQENVLRVAFRCLGNSYELMDNKTFVALVYKSMGLDVDSYDVKDFEGELDDIAVGSILRLGNEYAIYIGKDNDNYFMIYVNDSVVIGKVNLDDITGVIDFTPLEEKEEVIGQFLSIDNTDNTTSSSNKNSYKIIKGENQTVKLGKEANFIIDVEYELFNTDGEVYIDNNKLDKDDYSVLKDANGERTRIVIDSDYLNDLSIGKHTLKLKVKDKEVSTNFTIEEDEEDIQEVANKDVGLIIALCLIAIVGYLMSRFIMKKKQ